VLSFIHTRKLSFPKSNGPSDRQARNNRKGEIIVKNIDKKDKEIGKENLDVALLNGEILNKLEESRDVKEINDNIPGFMNSNSLVVKSIF